MMKEMIRLRETLVDELVKFGALLIPRGAEPRVTKNKKEFPSARSRTRR